MLSALECIESINSFIKKNIENLSCLYNLVVSLFLVQGDLSSNTVVLVEKVFFDNELMAQRWTRGFSSVLLPIQTS